MNWSGISENYDYRFGGSNEYSGAASSAFAAEQSGLSVSVSSSADVLQVISFGPSGNS